MIPVEVGIPFPQHETYNPEENHALMCYELDLLDEKRELVALKTASNGDLRGTSTPKLRREGSKKAT